ncbi:hypothetical protein T10_3876 [Trichinella papuae]|uniref:Uncharacterized protein n=1 Tax=Trichinella papuae TaxID=268474 RepID=A0A0V1N0X2_9BILA|nr:hypothetical protein T10_3876 [Trichinella papuae]
MALNSGKNDCTSQEMRLLFSNFTGIKMNGEYLTKCLQVIIGTSKFQTCANSQKKDSLNGHLS